MPSAWQTPTLDGLLGLLTGPEEAAARTRALQPGQADPAPGILSDVVALVRGYVAAASVALGPDGTVPPEAMHAAYVLARHRLLARIPGAQAAAWTHTEPRKAEHEEALAQLRDIAAGRIAVTSGAEGAPSAAVPQVARPRIAARPRWEDRAP